MKICLQFQKSAGQSNQITAGLESWKSIFDYTILYQITSIQFPLKSPKSDSTISAEAWTPE
jgi:hypothetical protein